MTAALRAALAAVDVSAGPVEDLTSTHPLVVIGAGQSALALVSRLPQKKLSGVLVLDSTGEWLGAWARRMASLGAQHVRQPCTSVPFPAALALQSFAQAGKREAELLSSSNRTAAVPSLSLFSDFVAQQLPLSAAAKVELRKARVVGLTLLSAEERRDYKLPAGGVRMTMDDGASLVAAQVVLACAWRQAAPLPPPLLAAGGPLLSFTEAADSHLDPPPVQPGARIAFLGGGSGAASLALSALRRGASCVTILARSTLRPREQEVEAGWLGEAKLREWRAEPELLRLRAAREARKGGSVDARTWRALREALRAGTLKIEERVSVVSCQWTESAAWRLRVSIAPPPSELHMLRVKSPKPSSTELEVEADALWSACGSAPHVGADPRLTALPPARILGGLPVLLTGQRWPGAPIYLTGAAAALSLGPGAGLPAGQRRGAEVVIEAMTRDAQAALAGKMPYDMAESDATPLKEEASVHGPWDKLPAAAQHASGGGDDDDKPPPAVDLSDLPVEKHPRVVLGAYRWSDDGDTLETALQMQLTIPLPERCAGEPQALRTSFGAWSVEIVAVGAESGRVFRLHLPRTMRRLLPKRCSAKLSKDGRRVLCTLHKVDTTFWTHLVGM